ncbi:MAG TPA: TonB-system energizer ExbB [Thiotrichaceae bacterium]|nr:TonB-system energizer ExbB [Thiotrichaceae bacterium]
MDILKESLDYLIIGILGGMSFIVLWLTIERLFYYRGVSLNQFDNEHDLEVSLTNNLTTIATIGSNAPYIGLLGTVIGIMLTFHDMGQSGNIDVKTIMLGLALALKATAAGLFVALPAIVFYNMLLRKVDVLTANWKVVQLKKGS